MKSSTGPEPISTKWIESLFARFTAIWPQVWLDITATVDPAILAHEWSLGLAGLSGEEIKRGIDHCRAHSRFPPSIAEFRSACRPGTAEQRALAARLAAADAQARLLPSSTHADQRQRGQEHIRAILERLKSDLKPDQPPTRAKSADNSVSEPDSGGEEYQRSALAETV
jgi:hypothetical protein